MWSGSRSGVGSDILQSFHYISNNKQQRFHNILSNSTLGGTKTNAEVVAVAHTNKQQDSVHNKACTQQKAICVTVYQQ